MRRALTAGKIYSIKHDLFEFEGIWREALGAPERFGAWLIWGKDKNGKTWLTLLLSNMLSVYERVYYVGAEEGFCSDFIDTMKRARIASTNRRLLVNEYIPMEELYKVLRRRQSPRIVVIDNITVYADELKNGALRKLLKDFPGVLFIFLAHEEDGEPYTSTAKMVKKLAKRIIHVQGLACHVHGRTEGAALMIDEERAALYHGQGLNGFKNATG